MIEPNFPTSYTNVLARVAEINPHLYSESRNYVNGSVSRISPYLTHGVISTRSVLELLAKHFSFKELRTFIYELMWREFFHRVWQQLGTDIFTDVKHPQNAIHQDLLPSSILSHSTGVRSLDKGIADLYRCGYLHNHVRMWLASVVTNLGFCHWSVGARWMYYYLVDGDLASNTLSWQWVAGTFSHKRYFANQENLNKFSGEIQEGTWLDRSYEELQSIRFPVGQLADTVPWNAPWSWEFKQMPLQKSYSRLLLYHPWNLDPTWHREEQWDRVLVLEPSHFQRFPVSPRRMEFILKLAEEIPHLQIFFGEVQSLPHLQNYETIIFREYPAVTHFPGIAEPRSWIVAHTEHVPLVFTKFWKRYEEQIEKEFWL